jgi:rubredoxin
MNGLAMTGRGRKGEKTMKYVCTACGYVYDPEENDGVAFADLPDDYECPLCGVGKEDFEPEE